MSYTVRIHKPSKIIDTISSNLSTPYFKFTYTSPGKYEIFYDLNTNSKISAFFNFKFYQTDILLLIIVLQLFYFLSRIFYDCGKIINKQIKNKRLKYQIELIRRNPTDDGFYENVYEEASF